MFNFLKKFLNEPWMFKSAEYLISSNAFGTGWRIIFLHVLIIMFILPLGALYVYCHLGLIMFTATWVPLYCQAQPQLQLKLSLLGWVSFNLAKSKTHHPPPTHPPTHHPPRIVVRRPNITKLKCAELNQDQMDRLNWKIATCYFLLASCYLLLATCYLVTCYFLLAVCLFLHNSYLLLSTCFMLHATCSLLTWYLVLTT